MSKRVSPMVDFYLKEALLAADLKSQLEAINQCVSAGTGDSTLECSAPLTSHSTSARKRRLWRACLAASLDREHAPHNGGAKTAIIAIPFVVTFDTASSLHQWDGLQISPKWSAQLASCLEETGDANANGLLNVGTRVLAKEELEHLDYAPLVNYLHAPSQGSLDAIAPGSFSLDPAIPTYRSRTLFVLASCQLSVLESFTFATNPNAPQYELEQLIGHALEEQGVSFETIQGASPTPLVELTYQFSGVARWELEANIKNAFELHNQGLSIYARVYGNTGYAEILGKKRDGSSVAITPIFSFYESNRELFHSVKQICESHQMPFSGVKVLRETLSSSIH